MSTSNKAPAEESTPHRWKTVASLFLATACLKILLMPSYRSTDFDVHRNWLAITRHLPMAEWYYNDVNGTTVHTLDYPPSFAFFEYLLSNNAITNTLLKHHQLLDERCLELLPDSDNEPSQACVIFHRSTVIISDIILWWGAWIASHAVVPWEQQIVIEHIPLSFYLIVLHPGLLWLDHVHFQYNGMLFGIFLASLGYLMQGNLVLLVNNDNNSNINKNQKQFHTCHWKAAVLFALLLTMKHLFLTLGPFYFVYLLRRYCLEDSALMIEKKRSIQQSTDTKSSSKRQTKKSNTKDSLQLRLNRLVTLGMYTLVTLLVPFLPFLKHLPQLGARLFPFGRGLVHDYWAANVWALYMFADKTLNIILGKSSLPEIPASTCALLLLVSLLPGLYYGAWKAAAQRDNSRLLLAVIYAALCSFQLGFHVHEKAILNAIIPMILLVANKSTTTTSKRMASTRFLFLQMTALGLLGIFPLLFRKVELPIKLASYTAYMALCYHTLMESSDDTIGNTAVTSLRTKLELWPLVTLVAGIVVILEVIPVKWFGKLEFLPLLVTSVGCAFGLLLCWIRLLLLLF